MRKNTHETKLRRLEDRIEDARSVIAAGSTFQGNISGPEGLQVSGKIAGSIKVKGLVKVDQGARIEGPVEAPYLLIEGEILGDINSAIQIELRTQGRVIGNISTEKLAMAEGSFLQGKIKMADPNEKPLVFTEKRNRNQKQTSP